MPTTETRKTPAADSGSVITSAIGDANRPSARASVQVPADLQAKPPEHAHPRPGIEDFISGVDDQGRRIVSQRPARAVTYFHACPRCQYDDQKRMTEAPELDAAALDKTVFLVPDAQYDAQVARAYLLSRYGAAAKHVGNSIDIQRLSYVPGCQIVVCARRGINGKSPGPSTKRQKDEEGVWNDATVDPATYLAEIVESEPIVIADNLVASEASLLLDQSVDVSELIARLMEVAYPYRIAIPVHKDDKQYAMRSNS